MGTIKKAIVALAIISLLPACEEQTRNCSEKVAFVTRNCDICVGDKVYSRKMRVKWHQRGDSLFTCDANSDNYYKGAILKDTIVEVKTGKDRTIYW